MQLYETHILQYQCKAVVQVSFHGNKFQQLRGKLMGMFWQKWTDSRRLDSSYFHYFNEEESSQSETFPSYGIDIIVFGMNYGDTKFKNLIYVQQLFHCFAHFTSISIVETLRC